ncbi:Mast cell protease 1A [Acipenser ruthenus]|uniref:trypsin n=1 Tax=Acipenser ruthenus TaxID=7906 RepID=A0A444V2T3_ACIRT|nr:Mast cell protease 1A [Acipenser ruthenus]
MDPVSVFTILKWKSHGPCLCVHHSKMEEPWTMFVFCCISASVDSRIINGHEVTPHSKPYMASLQIKGSHICGGFLVGKSFVMTAAHCFTRGVEMTVVLGAHDIINRTERTQRIAVRFYHLYPGYENKTLQNDIMLLQGDSGGPLVCNSKKPTAEGIVSFNELKACDNPQTPNVYTQVSKYLPWIKCIMGSTN